MTIGFDALALAPVTASPWTTTTNAYMARTGLVVYSTSEVNALITAATNGSVTSAITNGLATTNYAKSVTNNFTALVYTNPSSILYTSSLPALTNGFVTSSITNGLATTNYVNSITNGLATTNYVNSITNGLATTNYVKAATNALVTSSVTNGLATTNYVNTATNGLVTASITNGLATTNYAKSVTNNFTAIVYSNPAAYRLIGNTNFPGLALTNSSGVKLVSITPDGSQTFPRLYFGQAAEGVGAVFNRHPDSTTSDFYFGETADSGNYYFRGTGNMGIEGFLGIQTPSPTYPLDVYTTGVSGQFGGYSTIARFGGLNEANVFIDASASDHLPASLILAAWDLNTPAGPYGYYFGTDNAGNFRFSQMPSLDEAGFTSAKDFSGGLTGSLTLDKTGKIGIGTVSPAYMFDVNGAGHFNSITNTTYYGNGVGLTNVPPIAIQTNGAAPSFVLAYGTSGTMWTNVTTLIPAFVLTNNPSALRWTNNNGIYGNGIGLTNIPATGIIGTAVTNNASPTLTGLAVGAQTALDVNGNGKVGGVGLTNGVITGAITNLISTNDFAPSVVNNVGFIPTNPAVYIYRATVAQTGTAAPVPNVLYQSMTNVTWIRQAAGNYRAFCTNNYFTNFPIGKTIVNIQVGANYNLNAGDALAVSNSATGGYGTGGAYINVGGFTDGQFNNRFIEVYVYR